MSQQTPLTDLNAINEILACVGQAPVTSIDTTTNLYELVGTEYKQLTIPTNPDVAMAQQNLLEVSRRVQSEGWAFNKEYNFPITPEVNTKRVRYSDNMLQMDLAQGRAEYGNLSTVKRNGFLYERYHHTFEWNFPVLYCDMLWYFDWQDLPRPIQDYAIKKASAQYSMRVIGEPNLYQILEGQAMECRAYALEYDTTQGEYTFFGHPQGRDYYVPYQPYHSLYR